MNCSSPGSFVYGIFQARILEWFAISFSRGSSPPRDRTRVSRTASRFFTDWATREVMTREQALKWSELIKVSLKLESLEEDGVSVHLDPLAWQHLKLFGHISCLPYTSERVVCMLSLLLWTLGVHLRWPLGELFTVLSSRPWASGDGDCVCVPLLGRLLPGDHGLWLRDLCGQYGLQAGPPAGHPGWSPHRQ